MSLDLPGFADPVTGAQSCFRAVLEAMSRPGLVLEAGVGLTPPSPLDPATGAVLLTLIDADTALHIDPAGEAARDWIVFHTTPRDAAPTEADFVLALSLPKLASLPAGTDDEPQLGATVILQVAGFGTGALFELAGPGLATPRRLRIAGLPDDFAAQWAANHGLFPRGVDLILCAGTQLAALPRSLRISHVMEG